VTTDQITFGLNRVIRPALLMTRKTGPVVTAAAVNHARMADPTQSGTGTVLTWPRLQWSAYPAVPSLLSVSSDGGDNGTVL
jgi:hypothetical protein